jgi:hypothetical protein
MAYARTFTALFSWYAAVAFAFGIFATALKHRAAVLFRAARGGLLLLPVNIYLQQQTLF